MAARKISTYRSPVIQDIRDVGLRNLRFRNEPEPYNPLTDGTPERPENLPDTGKIRSPHYLWDKASTLIGKVLWILSDGGLVLVERYKCDRVAWIEFDEFDAVTWAKDYPARFQRAFKAVRSKLFSIDQHSRTPYDHMTPVEAARWLSWPRIDSRITDPELYMLLALASLADAIEALLEIVKHGDPAPHECEWPDELINDARDWISTGLALEKAETSKRDALELARAAHEADPDKARGAKVRQGASKGGSQQSKWSHRREEMQAAIDAIHASNPELSYEEMKRRAARRHGFSLTGLKRYTTNPKKKLDQPRH